MQLMLTDFLAISTTVVADGHGVTNVPPAFAKQLFGYENARIMSKPPR